MKTTTSKDGTAIAYDVFGSGPALIFIDGAMNSRKMSASMPIAKLLADDFTCYVFDRRGRGNSGDTQPWSLDHEIEDIEALIDVAGGTAQLFGQSSGAVLALEATNRFSNKVSKLGLYETTMIVDDSREPLGESALRTVEALIAQGKRDDAIKFFMRSVEVPGFVLFMMRLMPAWKYMRTVAHTLVYDFSIVSPYQTGRPLTKDLWQNVTMPVWIGAGGNSHTWMLNAQKALDALLPNTELHTLDGQTHVVKPAVIAPELKRFYNKG